jgi:amino acid adenylation domain-containing protein
MSDNADKKDSLSAKKQMLLEMLMKERRKAESSGEKQAIQKRNQADPLPLSFAQQRLWFLEQMNPGSPAYNIPSAVLMKGRLDLNALTESFNQVIRRHEVLRTVFRMTDGRPFQVILPELKINMPVYDLTGVSGEDQMEEAGKIITEDNLKPYDLNNGPLIRILLIKLQEEENVLCLNMHHIISDGWTLQILMREVSALYSACSSGKASAVPEPPIQYGDYTVWQREWVQGDTLKKQMDYWVKKLTGSQGVLELPTDFQRPPVQGFKGARQHLEIPAGLVGELSVLAQKKGATLFMILLTALKIVLHKYSGQSEIIVGTPIAGRNRTELEGLIGYFVNTLALRTDFSGNPSFDELLKRVKETTQGAYDNQDIPFENIVEVLQPERDLSRNPMYQVCFSYQSEAIPEIHMQGLNIDSLGVESGTARFDIELQLWKDNDIIKGFFEYSSDLFESSTMARFSEHFLCVLANIAKYHEKAISDISVMSEYEKKKILYDWNNTYAEYSQDLSVHRLFEQQVLKTPDRTAVIFEDQRLTYRELNISANQLANYLKKLGAGPETFVGICVERSTDMLIAQLGILKAGGTYIPIDPAYPSERIAFMIQDAKMPFIITQQGLSDSIPGQDAKIICIDSEWNSICRESIENSADSVASTDLAYIIYTSGSTGKPKGVEIPHGAVVNFLKSMSREPGICQDDRLLSVTTLSFDIAALELFLPVTTGACVVIAKRETVFDGTALADSIKKHDITIMQATPATWRLMIGAGWKGNSKLKVLCGGEPLPVDLAEQLLKRGASLWNMYGPTETTIWSSVWKIEEGQGRISVGKPIDNTQMYILDSQLQPVVIGATGELYIGGDGLAREYLKRPELTREKFIPNPYGSEPSARIYRTGDVARFMPDGTIEILGRIDHQIKIRGFRIELGEIETVLSKYGSVDQAVVSVKEFSSNDKRLVAYFTLKKDDNTFSEGDLRKFMKEELPEYMIPSVFVKMEALPLTPNGKINRLLLPMPETAKADTRETDALPKSELEKTIAGIWKEVLKVDRVGQNDNFFDLGGHSLLMTQVHLKLKEVINTDITMLDMFKYPTVSSLAKFLGGGKEEESTLETGLLSAAARRKSFDREGNKEVAVIGIALRFPGADSPEKYWENLRNGVESISFFSDEDVLAAGGSRELLNMPNFVKAEAYVDNIDLFDAGFFGYSPKEAESMDPQLRFMLECSWEALERAGYDTDTCKERIGVYCGTALSTYMINNMTDEHSAHGVMINYKERMALLSANSSDFVAQRVSYHLRLNGPSMNIQTACSTSMVSIHTACQGLLNGECDMALAGAVQIRVPQRIGYLYEEGGLPSPDGHCRPFDAKAKGTVHANGIGVVVVKRLEDAVRDGDNIYAVIKATAINNDGAMKVGFTAPSVEGQAKVVAEAQALAGISPESISFVEAFATGTELGDSIEVEALTQAFRLGTRDKQYCAIGSSKSNLGHMDHVSGMASIIKTMLALQHKAIPPTLHFETPNPRIDFENSPFFVNNKLLQWETDKLPRIAAVNNFAIGGTNVHAIMEEAPAPEPSGATRPYQLYTLSARTFTALKNYKANLVSYLEQNQGVNMADAAYTLKKGRKAFNHRFMAVCRQGDNVIEFLSNRDFDADSYGNADSGSREIAFMFSGEGTSYISLGKELYDTETVFRENVDNCREFVKQKSGIDIKELLYPEQNNHQSNEMGDGINAVMAFTVEYSLAQLWMSWGIKPSAMIGNSAGEITAACISGVFTAEDALQLLMKGSTVGEISLKSPRIPFISNSTGTWIKNSEALEKGCWTGRCKAVSQAGLMEIFKPADRVFLTMGSGNGLWTHIQEGTGKDAALISSLPDSSSSVSEEEHIITALGRCWLSGASVDWYGFYRFEDRRNIVLPTYPFERQSYWLKRHSSTEGRHSAKRAKTAENDFAAPKQGMEQEIAAIWSLLLGVDEIAATDNFFEMGGDEAAAGKLIDRLNNQFGIELQLKELFETVTIRELADLVVEKQIEGLDPEQLAMLLDDN